MVKILKIFLSLIIRVASPVELDDNEIKFIEKNKNKLKNKGVSNGVILVQIPVDYYYLLAFEKGVLALEKKHGVLAKVGIWPYSILLSVKSSLFKEFLNDVFSSMHYYLDRRKWSKLYSSIGVNQIVIQTTGRMIRKIKCRRIAQDIVNTIKSKEDVLNIKYKNILLGDLIYDTYLRFRNQATVDIKDKFLLKIIYRAVLSVDNMRDFFSTNPVKFFLTSYTVYIHHGIAVRTALQHGVKVYSEGSSAQHFKALSLSNNSHAVSFENYYEDFQKLTNKDKKLALAKKELLIRFKGGIDEATSYMKQSAYHSNDNNFNDNFDGVVFLHDFFDSPHTLGNLLFVDFWEWVIFTFDLIEKHNLNVAAKLHPNRNEDGPVIIKLKKLYPNMQWIDSDISNKTIFDSGIKYGVSVYGTVLSELAYHGINAISAGNHFAMTFNFVHNPSSIKEYKDLVLNGNKLKICENYREEVIAFYYMHTQSHKNGLKIDMQGMNALRSVDSSCILHENKI